MNATGVTKPLNAKQAAVEHMILERDAMERNVVILVRIARYLDSNRLPNANYVRGTLEDGLFGQVFRGDCPVEGFVATLHRKAYPEQPKPTFYEKRLYEASLEAYGECVRAMSTPRLHRELRLAGQSLAQSFERLHSLSAVFSDKKSSELRVSFEATRARVLKALDSLLSAFLHPAAAG